MPLNEPMIAMAAQIIAMSCDEQHYIATRVAANIGCQLVPEHSIQEAEDHADVLPCEVAQLREALKYGRDCVIESFEYVKSTDDQVMADARLQAIDAALTAPR